MVSVDDLVISVTISPTSDLGKLQKQLTALVGPKGEKPIQLGLGVDADLKRDLTLIKADLMLLTPTVLTSKETVKRAAFALANQVKTQEGVREGILERYSMEEDRLDEFMEELYKVSDESTVLNNEQQKRFIAEMQKFITITDMAEGDRKTIVTKLIGMLNEVSILQQKVQQSFRSAGVGFRGQYQVYQITKKSIDNQFTEQIAHYQTTDKDRFAKLKVIFKDISDPLRAMEAAYELMLDSTLDIEQLDRETIKSVDELKEIFFAQIATSLKNSTYMLEDFYKAGKGLGAGRAFGVGGPKRLDLIIKDGLKDFFDEHGGIIKFGEIADTATNILTELKLVGTKEDIEKTVQERINQGFTDIVLVAEEIKQTAIDAAEELLSKEIYKDINLALVEILPRALQLSTGTAADLEKMHEDSTKKVTDEIDKIADKLDTDMEELKYDKEDREAEKAELAAFLGEWEEEKDQSGKVDEQILMHEEATRKMLEDAAKDLEEIKKSTSETNKKMEGKTNDPEVVPEDK